MAKPMRLLSLVLLVVPMAFTARALDIQLIDITGMSPAQTAAFEKAAQMWESRLDDPIVVVLNVGFGDLEPNILGSTATALVIHPYTSSLRSAMIADAGNAAEHDAFSSLPAIGFVPALQVQDHTSLRTVTEFLIPTANAKALGVSPANPINPQMNGADGTVLFANAFASSFDYDRSDGIGLGKTDFIAVAGHEVGHALGFISATDISDHPQNASFEIPPTPLDIWRFYETGGIHPIGGPNPGPETRWITAGQAEYYDTSLNNVAFSHGVEETIADPACASASGRCQASHWSDDVGSLMDPTLAPGVLQNPTFRDTHALDWIGYDHTPKFIFTAEVLRLLIKWISDNPPDPPLPFPGFPIPTPPQQITPPFEPDGAGVVALGWLDGNRSATAFYRFTPTGPYTGPHFAGFTEDDIEDGQVLLFPDEPAPTTSPDSFMDFYMESDAEGVFFKAVGAFSILGTGFEPDISASGGYRFDLLFYGYGDGIDDDVDAFATYYLEADASGQPDPEGENVFRISPDQPNQMVVLDGDALPEPGTSWMLGAGIALLSCLARRRARAKV
jgi:hypothetical protein